MTLSYIRNHYKVPAKRGQRVLLDFPEGPFEGSITSARGAYLRVRVDGTRRLMIVHPTWRVEYL